MELKYSTDKGTQIVLSLLKEHGISKVIASPGTESTRLYQEGLRQCDRGNYTVCHCPILACDCTQQ